MGMKTFFSRMLLKGALLLCVTAPAVADTPVEELRGLLGEFQSLQGEFSQTLSDADGNALQDSAGEFIVQRPGKIYWHTKAPFEQTLVSDQQLLWLYDPDLEQVTIQAADESLQQTPLLLLSGDVDRISEYFHVAKTSEGRFELQPLKGEAAFQHLVLTFEDKKLNSVLLSDGLGQATLLSFSRTQANVQVSPDTFTFTIPPGTDIIRDE